MAKSEGTRRCMWRRARDRHANVGSFSGAGDEVIQKLFDLECERLIHGNRRGDLPLNNSGFIARASSTMASLVTPTWSRLHQGMYFQDRPPWVAAHKGFASQYSWPLCNDPPLDHFALAIHQLQILYNF